MHLFLFIIFPKVKNKTKCKTLIARDWLLDIKENGAETNSRPFVLNLTFQIYSNSDVK